jgi:hypothetical protein
MTDDSRALLWMRFFLLNKLRNMLDLMIVAQLRVWAEEGNEEAIAWLEELGL